MALSNRDCLPPVDFTADGLRTAASKQQKRVNFGGNWTDGKRHKQTGNPLQLESDAADKHPSKADKEQKIHYCNLHSQNKHETAVITSLSSLPCLS